ncbi:hypothetical protein F5Y18DRAFT_432125 [Xylariaceae sp. FL1019]|nr:hypothetical protein F5Y18DRAFT_432125 [Xylariaceae sp. FL1019]
MCVDIDCVKYSCGHKVNFYDKESRFCLFRTPAYGKKAQDTDFHIVNTRYSTIKNNCPRCITVYNLRVEYRDNGTKLPRLQFQKKVDELYLATGDGQSAISGSELVAAAQKAVAELSEEQIANLQKIADNNVKRILTGVKKDPQDKEKTVQKATPGAKCQLLRVILGLPRVFHKRALLFTFEREYGVVIEAWETDTVYKLASKAGFDLELGREEAPVELLDS